MRCPNGFILALRARISSQFVNVLQNENRILSKISEVLPHERQKKTFWKLLPLHKSSQPLLAPWSLLLHVQLELNGISYCLPPYTRSPFHPRTSFARTMSFKAPEVRLCGILWKSIQDDAFLPMERITHTCSPLFQLIRDSAMGYTSEKSTCRSIIIEFECNFRLF